MIGSWFSPRELLFLGMFQVRRFRVAQPQTALTRVIESNGREGSGGQAWGCVDSMAQYLGYCSYWRKRFVAFFGRYIQRRCNGWNGQVETFRNLTLTSEPFANLSTNLQQPFAWVFTIFRLHSDGCSGKLRAKQWRRPSLNEEKIHACSARRGPSAARRKCRPGTQEHRPDRGCAA
ncbi:hypothetical protein EMIT0P12_21078 [Pseudomonas sp. IT-P12]